MFPNKVTTIFYSPTQTSRKVAEAIASGINADEMRSIDLTLDESENPIEIENSIVVIAVPVYSGRVAATALERLHRLKGKNSPAILAVVYGNRDYDDALVELYDEVVKLGFTPLSAGAFIGEHSFSRDGMPIGEGRPDTNDILCARKFGADSLEKLHNVEIPTKLSIKGNRPYLIPDALPPMAPVCMDWCVADGMCIDLCPTHAISFGDDGNIVTDPTKCTLCCACVKGCPNSARVFDTEFTQLLHEQCKMRKEPELFI
ncbi:MAG: ferredoxin [Bacteroides sp.]|nr:ferredoxin [Bacteroides sp.]MCM1388973.1 ferredoxin [Bacteroides sp.]